MFSKKKLTATKSGIKLSTKKRKESWLPEDEEWLKNNPDIKFGNKELGQGIIGTVYELDNNPNLVIKVPNRYIPNPSRNYLDASCNIHQRTNLYRQRLREEYDKYLNNYKNKKMFTPTKIVTLGGKSPSGNDYVGLVRPKLRTSVQLSDEQLFKVRDMLLELSSMGLYINDYIQIGVDRKGNVQIYDMGDESIRQSYNKKFVYDQNNKKWVSFVNNQEKFAGDYGYIMKGDSDN